LQDIRYFILCRDRAEARRARRIVAEQGVGFNVQVGTWVELVQASLDAYLLNQSAEGWQERLNQAAALQPDAFWSESYQVAPDETISAVAAEMERLLRALGPDTAFVAPTGSGLSERAKRHLSDLVLLHESMDSVLPADLEAVRAILQVDSSSCLRAIKVAALQSSETFDPWQAALIAKLNCDSLELASNLFDTHFSEFNFKPAGEGTALGFLQRNLYSRNASSISLDPSLQWLAVRDYLEEAEVAAGMVQQALRDRPELRLSDLALLLPDDPNYSSAVHEVFSRAGLPLSGLIRKQRQRDLVGELIFHLLQTLRKPAPTMAMAAFVTSPLLPWTRAVGFEIAAALMSGRYDLKSVRLPAPYQNELLDLIRFGIETPAGLRSILNKFPQWLDATPAQQCQAVDHCTSLLAPLDAAESIPWDQLIALAAPRPATQEIPGELTREGIAVCTEHEEPWRPVKTLFVLGFNAGHYPREAGISPVFSDADLLVLKTQGYKLESSSEVATRCRELFSRQLGCAMERLHFLLSRRDALGKSLAPSASLPFIAQLFGRGEEPDELLLELDSEDGRKQARGLALAPQASQTMPKKLKVEDLQLSSNLLEINKNGDGNLRPQSPSSLETLMTSPLAWLLNRAGLEPREWAPETLDVMAKGSLAHAVFELLFVPGETLPSAEEVELLVPQRLREATQTLMPYLNRPEWKVERYHLEKEILLAARRWREVLETIGAKVLGVEVWLTGLLDQQPIHGSADLLMELPDGKIYVVDYKKSSSKKRKERMSKGYDSQASLYRIMLKTGEASFRTEDGSKVSVDQDREIGALYYLMNDQVALADTDHWLENSLSDIDELGADVAAIALPLIRERLVQVAKGKIMLNRASDEKWFEKNAGMPLYALDNSPLIRMHMLPAEEDE
jgi:RecB family exonuclease